MSSRRIKAWHRGGSLLLVVASVAATIGLLEIAIRAWGVSVETVYINRKTIELDANPNLQFRLIPTSTARAEVAYRINALGSRGPETMLAKPPATRTTPDAIEVINLGVPGYNLAQSFEWLQRSGLQYRPDLVIISVCLNDLESIFSYEYGLAARHAKEDDSPDSWTRLRSLALDHSMFAAFLEYRFSLLANRNHRGSKANDTANSPQGRSTVSALAMLAAKRADQSSKLESVFGSFARLWRQNGEIPSLVVLFPGLDYDYAAYPHAVFHELVADAAAHAGLPFLDLLACYSKYPVRDLAVDPVHPNPLGHRVAAHAMLDAIDAEASLLGSDFDLTRIGNCFDYRVEDFPAVRGPRWAFLPLDFRN